MISQSAANQLDSGFGVYEHEWRYLAGYLGEPHLINDLLVFDDGRTLNICAFPVGDIRRRVGVEEVEDIVSKIVRDSHGLVHVWGSVEIATELQVGFSRWALADPAAADECFTGEFTVDLHGFDLEPLRDARKSLRSAVRKGLVTTVSEVPLLSAHHLALIEHWRSERPIGMMGAVAAQSLGGYVGSDHVTLVEVKHDDQLRGFGVVACPSDRVVVSLMSFTERLPGARVDDALMNGMIEFALERGADVLHLGYAGTEGLESFKRKWGAASTGPEYGQAIYVADDGWKQRALNYDFFWTSRVLSPELRLPV